MPGPSARVVVPLAATLVAAVSAVVVVRAVRDDGDGRRPDVVIEPSGDGAGAASSAAWSADGSALYVVDDAGISVYEGDPLVVTNRLESSQVNQQAIWNGDHTRVALAGDDTDVVVWDPATGEAVLTLDGRLPAAWSPDGSSIATRTDEDGDLVIHNARSGNEVNRFAAGDRGVEVLELAWPTADRLVALTGLSVVALEPQSGVSVWEHVRSTRPLAASAAAGAVAVGDGYVYGLVDGTDVGRFDVASYAKALDWSPGGAWLFASGDDDQPQLWDAGENASRPAYESVAPYDVGVVWSPDSLRVAIPDVYDQRVVVIDVTDAGDAQQLSTGRDAVLGAIAWSPEGDRIAAVGRDGSVFVWSIGTAG